MENESEDLRKTRDLLQEGNRQINKPIEYCMTVHGKSGEGKTTLICVFTERPL